MKRPSCDPPTAELLILKNGSFRSVSSTTDVSASNFHYYKFIIFFFILIVFDWARFNVSSRNS